MALFVNTLPSPFYYPRWIIPAFQPANAGAEQEAGGRWSTGVAITAAAASLLLGLAAGLAWTAVSA